MPAVAWAFATGSPIAVSPRVADGMIYVGGDRMSALDAATGHLRWRYRSGPGYTVPPLVAAGAAYVGYVQFGSDAGQPGRGTYRVYAMDPVNGQVRWAYPARHVTVPRAASQGMVFAGSYDRSVYALDAASGDLRWAAPASQPIFQVTVAGATVYAESGVRRLCALDAATGRVRWVIGTRRDIIGRPATQASVTSPAVMAGPRR